MAAAIGIQIGIGTEIDEKARNSTPIVSHHPHPHLPSQQDKPRTPESARRSSTSRASTAGGIGSPIRRAVSRPERS